MVEQNTKEELRQEIIKILREEMVSDDLKYISYDRFLSITDKIIKLLNKFRGEKNE